MNQTDQRTKSWYMMTVVGKDRPGIVARLTQALFEGGCNLGETSMARLGGNFTIMMMVESDAESTRLQDLVGPVAEALQLHVHIDSIQARLHEHSEPNVQISLYGADRAGIVAEVTGVLAEAGLNILDLNSEVAGTADKPVYIMMIDGHAEGGIEALEPILERLKARGIEATLTPIATLVG